MEELNRLCMSYIEPILTISSNLGLIESINKLNKVSHAMDIPFPQIIASTEYELQKSRIMYTGHKDWVYALSKKLEAQNLTPVGSIQYGVFISGFGLTSAHYEQTIFENLEKSKIKIEKYIRDASGILLIYTESEKEKIINFCSAINK